MSKDIKPRKHRHKRHYTFMVISGDSDGSTKRLHLNHTKTQVLAYTLFIIVLAIICYIIYSAITINSLEAIEAEQKAKIDELVTTSSTLEATNDDLSNKVELLTATLNQRIVDEQASAEEAEELAIPSGLPGMTPTRPRLQSLLRITRTLPPAILSLCLRPLQVTV